MPPEPGAHPAVILLHGAVPRGSGDQMFADQCRKLAAAGYYAMFVEYYSQAGPARPRDLPVTGKGFAAWVNENFPTWTREIAERNRRARKKSHGQARSDRFDRTFARRFSGAGRGRARKAAGWPR